MHYRRLSLGLLSALAVTACNSADPSVAGSGADYRLINVTPGVVMQLQQQQRQTYSADASKAAPDSSYVYRIGPGDVLYVKLYIAGMNDAVSGYASTNEGYAADSGHVYNEVTVKENGTISIPVPLIGILPVAGKTLAEANYMLHDALAKYYKYAQSAIEVAQFKSHKIQVTGDVNKPSQEYLTSIPLHILEAIGNAGGLGNTADLAHATVTHKNGEAEKVNLSALINNGDASQNLIMQDGDTLNIPTGNKVFVMGAVSKPSMQYIKVGRMTVMEALSDAEGLDNMVGNPGQFSGSYKQIYVIRGAISDPAGTTVRNKTDIFDGKSTDDVHVNVYHLNCSDGTGLAMAAQFPLEANDVVYVSPTSISEWGRFISQVLPANLGYLAGTELLRLQPQR